MCIENEDFRLMDRATIHRWVTTAGSPVRILKQISLEVSLDDFIEPPLACRGSLSGLRGGQMGMKECRARTYLEENKHQMYVLDMREAPKQHHNAEGKATRRVSLFSHLDT